MHCGKIETESRRRSDFENFDSKSRKIYLRTMLTEMEIVGFTLREKFYTLLNLHISV